MIEEQSRRAVATRRIQAGFDLDVYGVKAMHEPQPSPEYFLVYPTLEKIVETVLAHATESPLIEFIPTGRHFQEEAMLRIRLHSLGMRKGRGVGL